MSTKDARNTIDCERCLEWIEPALDDRLDEVRRVAFDEHLARCESCSTAHEDARVVHELFQRAGRPVCPDHVVDSILAQVDAHIETDPRPDQPLTTSAPPRHRPGPGPMRRPAWMATAAAILLFLGFWLPGRFQPSVPDEPDRAVARGEVASGSGGATTDPGQPTEAEVEVAAEEMKMALALVSRTMVRATHIVESEVSGHIARPLRSSVEPVFREISPAHPGAASGPEGGQSSTHFPPRGEC